MKKRTVTTDGVNTVITDRVSMSKIKKIQKTWSESAKKACRGCSKAPITVYVGITGIGLRGYCQPCAGAVL